MNQPVEKANSEPDLTGRTIGDYLLIRRLGRGGMADVFLAEQISLKRHVALKVLFSELARDHSYVERFKREAQAAAGLGGANIVQIYEIGERDGLHFIAQEYVTGRNLRQYITRYGAVEPVMAINVISQVAMALQKAVEGDHEVIHRDIKPENIMLSPGGEVKVTDFGLARVNRQGAQDLTQIGITMGTPLYMSPEQVQGLTIDPRTDIYSLGVTAWHMLAGKPPFEGENALAVALQHVNEIPESLHKLRPDAPPKLCDLIHRMLAKSPDDRPANATVLLREVKKIKIDIDGDWDDLIEKLAVTETRDAGLHTTVPESALAVTRQLQSVMRGNIRPWWQSATILATVFLATLMGIGLGTLYSISNPPPDPLSPRSDLLNGKVEIQASAKEQYRYAYNFPDSAEHWDAVETYFPIGSSDQKNETVYYVRLSFVRLGELYLRKDQPEDALKYYTFLAEIVDPLQAREFNLIGLSGQAVTLDRMNTNERFTDRIISALSELQPHLGELEDKPLKEQVVSLREKYSLGE